MENILKNSELLSYARHTMLLISSEFLDGFLSSAHSNTTIKNDIKKENEKLVSQIYQICALSNLSTDLKSVFNTSFLYHHLSIFQPLIETAYQQVRKVHCFLK